MKNNVNGGKKKSMVNVMRVSANQPSEARIRRLLKKKEAKKKAKRAPIPTPECSIDPVESRN
jgi:hypothetical protein